MIDQKNWFSLDLCTQLANVGADVGRAIAWRQKDVEKSKAFFCQAIDLLDATIADQKNRGSRLIELCRLKEVLGDYFLGSNQYGSTEKSWGNYFYFFNAVASAAYFSKK